MNYKDENVKIDYPIFDEKKFKKTKFGKNYYLRCGTVIYSNSVIGENFSTGHNVIIREENLIGKNVSLDAGCYLKFGNKIGNNVKMQSYCIMERVELGDNVFLGPGVIFTDDLHPPCPAYKECTTGAKVGKNTVIGANCTILPGVVIGKNCLIGAGSVVTKDIEDGKVAIGSPAKVIKNRKDLKCVKNIYKRPYEWQNEDC
jgi:acetyltransferase-like isoleucine patch superfamily enzyme